MTIIGQGGYDSRLFCSFETDVPITPNKIKLPMGIGGISWSYQVKYNTIDTYGGQVIQILGVSIEDLVFRGNFGGGNPQWGEKLVDGKLSPRFGDMDWIGDYSHPWANGIRQMGNWFREYFEATTQGPEAFGQRFKEKSMLFKFPARGWEFSIRPTDFPNIEVNDETLAPEWTVQASFVDEDTDEKAFLRDVTQYAYNQLNQFRFGVGFVKENPFSEYLEGNEIDLALELLDDWEESIWSNYSEEEIDLMLTYGYSAPGVAFDMSESLAGVTRSVADAVEETEKGIKAVTDQLKDIVGSTQPLFPTPGQPPPQLDPTP